MDPTNFLRVVKERLFGAINVEVTSRRRYSASVLVSSKQSPEGEVSDRTAAIIFSGEESFMLELDGDRFFYQESAVEEPEQTTLIGFLTDFAAAYVKGEGNIQVHKGLFGRTYEELNIVVQGRHFTAKSGPLIPTWREVPSR